MPSYFLNTYAICLALCWKRIPCMFGQILSSTVGMLKSGTSLSCRDFHVLSFPVWLHHRWPVWLKDGLPEVLWLTHTELFFSVMTSARRDKPGRHTCLPYKMACPWSRQKHICQGSSSLSKKCLKAKVSPKYKVSRQPAEIPWSS